MTAAGRHPFDLVARVLAERLSGAGPSPMLRAALGDPAVDWEAVVGQASGHFVLPAFAAAARDLPVSGSLEPELRAFLEAVHAANAERNAGLRAELAEVVRALNRVDIEPVLLKGAIRLVDGLYPDRGWRMMRDLDLLVPGAALGGAAGALAALGYGPRRPARLESGWRRDHHHFPELVRPGCGGSVELHAELFRLERGRRLLRGAEVASASRPVRFDGVEARLPSVEHQIVHLVGHCQLSDRGYSCGRVQMRDRLEAAALERWSPDRPDWAGVVGRFAAAGCRRHLLSFLLSLDDVGFRRVPVDARPDRLTSLQGRRVALQDRSATIMRLGSRFGLYAAVAREVVSDPGARRRLGRLPFSAIARKVQHGPVSR